MYCDRRLGGVERWSAFVPSDAQMRIPDEMRDCTCFLCVKDRAGNIIPIGTAFSLSYPYSSMAMPQYLVTAKHCVTKALDRYGALYARVNTLEGSTELIELGRDWTYSPDEGVEIAVMPWELDRKKYIQGTIDARSSAEGANQDANEIGIGNELIVIGLFSFRHGAKRNIPIVRQGIISSMPGEPLVDKNTGLSYHASLAELQSIGGLSGSPVFVHVPVLQFLTNLKNSSQRERMRKQHPAGFLYLFGVVRGHFDEEQDWAKDDEAREPLSVNTGIATITPINEVLAIVSNDKKLDKLRRERVRRVQSAETLDSAFPTSDRPFSQIDFENALKKVSRRLPPSQSDEEK
jgi:hypothetical protein